MFAQANALIQKFLPSPRPTQQTGNAKLPSPITPVQSAQRGFGQSDPNKNPFMIALNPDNPEFMGYYGVNRPLKQPMFFGYQDNKPLYGGSRLFILY
jgi:hypothetical protein